MTLISGENITRQYEDRLLFDRLSFSLNEHDRVGLVGPNGIGKTTLFDIMAGRALPDSGHVVRAKGCEISYVEQELAHHVELSLFDYVTSARADLLELREQIEAVERELAQSPDSDKLIDTLGDLQHRFETDGGYAYEAEVKLILIGLGFTENRFHNKLSAFSGGEKNRASLARVLAGKGNLLLLDEPTNHLDIDSTIWLEEYLTGLDKAYVIVSHDRAFLGNTVEKVWELNGRKIEQFHNGFEQYLMEREQRRHLLEHQVRHQQEEIARIEDFIRRNIAGQKTKQAQSRRRYLAKLKRIDGPEADNAAPSISIDSSGRSHNLVLAVENAAFGYGHQRLVDDVSFNLYRDERIGLIGPNGAGKTTILKTLLGELEQVDGEIRIGNKVEVGYFDQELSDLDDNNTVLDELWLVDPLALPGRLRSYLARYGFRGEDVFKRIGVLSGGEKTKLALAKLLFLPVNFLIFDEPTNHLDIDSRQALEEGLLNYNGTSLIVSHDRYFLDKIVTRIIAVENGTASVYLGNYSYYTEKKAERETPTERKAADPSKIHEYEEFKRLSRQRGRLKKELQSVRSKIQDHETILERLEQDLEYNIPKNNWEKLDAAAKEKKRVEDVLLELYDRLEQLEELNADHSEPER